jgi:uncharacterized protein YjiS (DUF1127 family)
MSTIFGETLPFELSPPSRPGGVLHQSNSWRTFTLPWRIVQFWAQRRSQRKTLGDLIEEKHLLDDLGFTRAQALHEAAKPFWRR